MNTGGSETGKVEVDTTGLMAEINRLAAISEQPPPVVTRVLFSEADVRARAHIRQLCGRAGLVLREDGAGNLFARWAGSDSTLAAVGTGSHIDAIPHAGKFDGVVGVLGAIEAVTALQRAGFVPRRSLEIIVFTAEEPTRFGVGCLGSRLLSGVMTAGEAAALVDENGKTFEQWRVEAGCGQLPLEQVRLSPGDYEAFVELHIEQGPWLEAEGIDIGVVEKIAAPAAFRITLTGEGGHAGAVLMPDRHDALLAGAEIALKVEAAAKGSGSPDTVATTGVFRIQPGAINSIPCEAYLEIDLRDTSLAARDMAWEMMRTAVGLICIRRGVQYRCEVIYQNPPAICDAGLMALLEKEAAQVGCSSRRMISRAYHDSLFMAQLCPTTMIFIPCFKGYSHRPDEYASPEAITRGVAVLAGTIRELCR